MFKLVAVGGKVRGQEFILEEGENTLGRSNSCSIPLQVNGISKNHMSITVSGKTAFVEDLGSSNGTIVNNKLIKEVTVKNGDKIALPNIIFQLVFVEEKKKIIKKKVARTSEGDDEEYEAKESMPSHLPGKIRYFFKHKIMPILYGFNEQYEWGVMVAILLFLFIALNIAVVIFPVLSDSKRILLQEIVARATQYTNEVARLNKSILSRGELDRINTSFLESEEAEGVQSYTLFDPQGFVYRPISKQNSNVQDPFDVDAKIYFASTKDINVAYKRFTNDGDIGVAKAIIAYNVNTGSQEMVGIIAIKFRPKSLSDEAAINSKAYLESLVVSVLMGLIFFGMLYYLSTRAITEMRDQIEEVLRGKRKDLSSKMLMQEIIPLRNSVNSILQRLRELQNEDTGEFAELEEDGPYLRTLQEFMRGNSGPVMILNSEKLIENINPIAEDLVGMRESTASGTSLLDSARDQGFAATVIDLCDQSANHEGTNQNEIYELGGVEHVVNVTALIGKDNFAKAFYITFVVDD